MKKHFFCQDCKKEFEANSDQFCPHCKSIEKHVELHPFVYFVGDTNCRWHEPSYGSDWTILWAASIEDANDVVWEMASDRATNYEQDAEPCECCNGAGCEECSFEGEIYADWADHVEDHVYYVVRKYDAELHYKVPSEFPEYLKYKKEQDIEKATHLYERRLADVKHLEYLLAEAHKNAEAAKISLNECLEQYGEKLVK